MALYPKPYLSINDLIKQLESRGLLISDHARAAHYLEKIGYYRLSGYWYPMRDSSPGVSPGQPATVLSNFRQGAEFGQAVDLYIFDKKLRLLILDAIERVEIGVRAAIIEELGKRNPFAHIDPNEVHGNFSRKRDKPFGQTDHEKWLNKLQLLITRSNEEFIAHFKRNHRQAGVADVPVWIAFQVLDFGALSRFLAGMQYSDLQSLCSQFGLKTPDLLCGWMRAINGVRNTCAHHSRLWNRPIVDNPPPPKVGEHPELDHLATNTFAHPRLYSVAVALRFLLKTINPKTTWQKRLIEHCATFPNAPGVVFSQSGFPKNWEQLPLWS